MNITHKSYIIGFISSAILILLAFIPVYVHVASHHRSFSHEFLTTYILVLAVIQAVLQLKFFLHLKFSPRSGWDFMILVSTIGLILIVVVGSIWIMNHLNYNMSPDQINHYIDSQDGL